LNEVEDKDWYRFEISNRFSALENLPNMDINAVWETERISKFQPGDCIVCYELKKHKPWFDERCSEQVDEWKQDNLQWLQDQRVINIDNLNNVRREASRHFRNNKREYLKDKINELPTKRKLPVPYFVLK
jgi:hypothetical protein